ncbi:hypothetical protein RJ640_008707 [Escallonia rubra]|uniref:Chromo domain-containing protein n=1 Tax=Escallonia rubra TaxID=112253 RepID=A0AA88RHI0_9ASTE|nr:hypothetical protein RJ640_008707 [Escallonia rubra]
MAGKDTSVGTSKMSEKNVVVEHGRDPLSPPSGKKGGRGRNKSRDALASLDGRTGHLEIDMGDVKDRVGIVEQNLQTLEEHVLEKLETLKRAVGAQDELRERFMKLFANLQEQLDGVKVGMKETKQDVAMSKGAIVGGAEDLLFNLVDGLQSWAKRELQRRCVKDVDEAITMAESLTEGPHWARDCQRQGKLDALVKEKENEESECETVHIGSLQVLNALQMKNAPQVPTGEGQTSTSKGLLYVETKLNGKHAQVLVDTGATYNFITMGEAGRLGLSMVDGRGWLKTVNIESEPLQGTVRRVEMWLGAWRGLVEFSVATMDDFKERYRSGDHLGGRWIDEASLTGGQATSMEPCGMAPPKVEKLATISKAKGEIIKLIKEGLLCDPLAKELLQLVKSGKTERLVMCVKGENQAEGAKILDATQVSPNLQRREAEYVLGDKLERGRGVPSKQHYLVKWKGLPEHKATWGLAEELGQFEDLVDRYHEDVATRASPN